MPDCSRCRRIAASLAIRGVSKYHGRLFSEFVTFSDRQCLRNSFFFFFLDINNTLTDPNDAYRYVKGGGKEGEPEKLIGYSASEKGRSTLAVKDSERAHSILPELGPPPSLAA